MFTDRKMTTQEYELEVSRTRAERMCWWDEARFGMFIHYSVFSLTGTNEWTMALDGYTPEEYEEAKKEAFLYDEEVVIEQYIKGREFSVGVMDGKALPVIEIAPLQGFYDYKNKYQAGSAVETCPAVLSEEKTKEMQGYAEKAFKILRLKNYARMDFMMNEQEEIYCLEANTLPGMTPTSLLPQEAAAAGISFSELCEMIIAAALR